MKLSRQLRRHTANPKSGTLIRTKIQPASLKMIIRSPAHAQCSGTMCCRLSVIVLEKRKGALA
jgi:hypothetical protein